MFQFVENISKTTWGSKAHEMACELKPTKLVTPEYVLFVTRP